MIAFLKEKGANISGKSSKPCTQPIIITESKSHVDVIAGLNLQEKGQNFVGAYDVDKHGMI